MKRTIHTFLFGFFSLLILPGVGSFAQTGRNHNKSSIPYRGSYQRIANGCGADFGMEIRNGALWAWGQNTYGQLGDGTTMDRYSPVQVGSATNWVTVAGGTYHALAIRGDGTLWAWGNNGVGQLGDGTTTNRTSPTQVGAATNWVSVACGANHSLAISSDGKLWAWGYNNNGQLGIGNTTNQSTPVQIGSATNWVSVACGLNHTVAISSDGKLWAWGYNNYGQLGDGTMTDKNAPIQIGSAVNWVGVAGGAYHTLALRSDGTLWAWGNNGNGRLGDGTTTDRNSPVQVGTANNWVSIAGGYLHSLATSSDGKLWAWGWNAYGQLGLGITGAGQTIPTQVGSATNWVTVACGFYHSLAVSSDGKLWAWGRNANGQLGDGTTTDKVNPVLVGLATNWVSVACGNTHTLAITADGKLWAWGSNSNGQLGDGTTTDKTSPVQIGTATNWVSLACGANHSIAITADGKLWAWGSNSNGQLGDGTTTDRNTPVQVGTATNWMSIAVGQYHTLAITADGKLWAWGSNSNGQLGDGTTTDRNAPLQIGTATNWVSVAGGAYFSRAISSDGALWAWGYNNYGQLGDGTTTSQNTPELISSQGNVVSAGAGCGTTHSPIIKADRANICLVGYNIAGQLANGTMTNSSSYSCSNNVCRANSLATASSTSYTQPIPGIGNREDFESGCILAASVAPSGASPVIGSMTTQVFVDAAIQSANNSKYVQRHYGILPAGNPNMATATITLYFLQSEFDAYNTAVGSGLKLPTGPADAAGIANLKVTQYHGTPSGGNGPANYPATWGGSGPAHILIDPADANIVWNADDSRWEVTFAVTGFSGFFVNASASSNPLPVGLTDFSAKLLTDKNALLSWSVATPKDGSSYTVERSADASGFRAIGTVPATLSSSYSLNDYAPLGGKSYYRLKITETDGSSSYSNVVSIFIGSSSYVNVAPSPAHNYFVVSTNAAGLTATLSDMHGRVQQRFAVSNDMRVDISTLPAGVYLLKVSSGEVMKIVKE